MSDSLTKLVQGLAGFGIDTSNEQILSLIKSINQASPNSGFTQWTTRDNKEFMPACDTVHTLEPGVYEICSSQSRGIFFEKVPIKTEDLIRLPDTNSDRVLNEIQVFWDRKDIFESFRLPHKRGILLYGPPGSGKSCTIQLICEDVVKRGGVVLRFTNPSLTIKGFRIFREIQADTPAVVLMEDIDSLIEDHCESDILNILDGFDLVDKVVFLATTNYPERLGKRIVNRPSRFDKRFKIETPTAESRRLYLEFLLSKNTKNVDVNTKIDVDMWVRDTEKMSIAHMKELFTAVIILGNGYEEAVETLKEMEKELDSMKEDDRQVGFARSRKCSNIEAEEDDDDEDDDEDDND